MLGTAARWHYRSLTPPMGPPGHNIRPHHVQRQQAQRGLEAGRATQVGGCEGHARAAAAIYMCGCERVGRVLPCICVAVSVWDAGWELTHELDTGHGHERQSSIGGPWGGGVHNVAPQAPLSPAPTPSRLHPFPPDPRGSGGAYRHPAGVCCAGSVGPAQGGSVGRVHRNLLVPAGLPVCSAALRMGRCAGGAQHS